MKISRGGPSRRGCGSSTRIRQYILERKRFERSERRKLCASAASEANYRLRAVPNDATWRRRSDRDPPLPPPPARANLDTPLPVARAFTLFWVYPSDEPSPRQYKVTFELQPLLCGPPPPHTLCALVVRLVLLDTRSPLSRLEVGEEGHALGGDALRHHKGADPLLELPLLLLELLQLLESCL